MASHARPEVSGQNPSAGTLLATLGRMPVIVGGAAYHVHDVWIADYPENSRPSSTVTLHGAGEHGLGELVAWTRVAHERLAARVHEVPRGAARLGEWVEAIGRHFPDAYERAALEAAAVDLALRQHATNLFRLAGVAPRPVRYVVSFGPSPDPLALAAREPGRELKLDVDPSWTDGTWAALATLGRVAIVDFKGAGRADDVTRALRALADALVEDPPPWADIPDDERGRVAADATVPCATALDDLPHRPGAVNVKPARMGGVLEALACIARCQEAGLPVYLGGMFEVGAARRQLRDLAALFAPEGPNDIAPIAAGEGPPPRPERLEADPALPGFGAAP